MRIHHLNCGTLRPLGRRAINGEGSPLLPARLVCHCLLIETERRLVLVDTGFGLADVAGGRRPLRSATTRLGRTRALYTRFLTRAKLDPEETAVRRLPRLGYSPGDVTDIVLTHLDFDHAGGLRDFPQARVHVHEAEHSAAMSPASGSERFRYWSHQWGHGPEWAIHAAGGEPRFGLERLRRR